MKTLKQTFFDICEGKSHLPELGLWFWHPTLRIENDVEEVHAAALEKAKGNGLLTERELLDLAITTGKWSKSKDQAIKTLESDFKRQNQARYTPTSESHMVALRNELKLIEENWNRWHQERAQVVDNSAEQFAHIESNNALILLSLSKQEGVLEPALTWEDFDYLSNREMMKIMNSFYELNKNFSLPRIKEIAISDFFISRFSICEDKFDFLGKPTYFLTKYQAELIHQGTKFCNMMQNSGEIPEDYNDPDGVEDYFYLKRAGAIKSIEELAKEKAKWNF